MGIRKITGPPQITGNSDYFQRYPDISSYQPVRKSPGAARHLNVP
jgi:hypothetical protein